MMTNENVNRWCALHTTSKSEYKLMRRLNAAGYTAFCPMQIEFKKWNGRRTEICTPLFSGCLFVEETPDIISFAASQKASVLMDSEGRILSINADKAELPAKFAQLLK